MGTTGVPLLGDSSTPRALSLAWVVLESKNLLYVYPLSHCHCVSNAAAATHDEFSKIRSIPTPSDSSVIVDIFLFS